MSMNPARRLTPTEWAEAALARLVADGPDAVSVEGVARDLGVTKGSFYWHYPDRAALLAGSLDLWERATEDLITQLSEVSSPYRRFEALMRSVLGDRRLGPLDAALLARADDPVIGPVVRRVTERRLAYLARLFVDLGGRPADAAQRARIVLSLYAGHFAVARSVPNDSMLSEPSRRYVSAVVDLLTAGLPPRAQPDRS